MSKTKKLLACTLAVLALAAVPSTSVALSGSGEPVAAPCSGTGAGGGC
ncbi:MAG: hypothetical protein M3O89_08620 [Actinomycetota bacterium]|nr:hypothetical protein [Actinomycetota bacterium]